MKSFELQVNVVTMPNYKYQGFDQSGAPAKGLIRASSLTEATEELERKRIIIEKIDEQSQSGWLTLSRSRVGFADIEFLTSELSILLNSGVKVDKALALLARARLKPALSALIETLNEDLKSGESLAAAFAKHGKYFDSLYVTLLKLGEESGELPSVLEGLARDMKFKRQLKAKITQAAVYPAVILLVCIASVFFIFNYIVPQMSSLFEGRENLPGYTQFVLGLSEWMQNYQFYLLALIILGVFGVYQGLQSQHYRERIHQYVLQVPLLNSFIRMTERIKFCSGSALMLNAGLSADRVLRLVSGTINNMVLRQEVMFAWEQVRQGSSLNAALSNCQVMDDFYISLLEIGEESGELERVFAEIAERSREDFESTVTKFTNLLEPALILTMGLLVGGIVVTLILSIVSITDYG